MGTPETDNDEDFRQEVRAFMKANVPPQVAERSKRSFHDTKEDVIQWATALNKKGWGAPNWPKEYGGTGWTINQRHIFEEESYMNGAPRLSPQGLYLVGPVIQAFGNQKQKDFFLPKIITAEHFWAQGFSEPNSGSDLASLQTKAIRDGDHYVVNGQKIWTSDCHFSDWLFLLVRTKFDGKPQGGISFLLVDLKTPGITVRQIVSIEGGHVLNEVFLDDVRVPVENLIGEENMGWTYAKHLLGDERFFSGEVPRNKRLLQRLKEVASQVPKDNGKLIDDKQFARGIAQLEIDLMAHEVTSLRASEEEAAGIKSDLPTASILKVRGTEMVQKIGEMMVDALGDAGTPYFEEEKYLADKLPADMPAPEYAVGVAFDFFYRRSMTIYGGTNEIQRNIIASMLLRA